MTNLMPILSTVVCALMLLGVFKAGEMYGIWLMVRNIAQNDQRTLEVIEDYKKRWRYD